MIFVKLFGINNIFYCCLKKCSFYLAVKHVTIIAFLVFSVLNLLVNHFLCRNKYASIPLF